MDPNQLATLQSMIQSLATQVGSFTNSVVDLGNKLNTVVNSLDKTAAATEKAQRKLSSTIDDTAYAADKLTESLSKMREASKNSEYLNNAIGGYGKAIQTAAERIDGVLKKADGFDIDGDKIVKSFNSALSKSVGQTATAQLTSVAKIKQFQMALSALGQAIHLTKDQQATVDFKVLTKSLNSLDKETREVVSKISGIDLSNAGNFTKMAIVKASSKLSGEQKRQLAKNLNDVTKTFADGVTPPANFKSQIFDAIGGSMAPAARVGAERGIFAAISHPSVVASGASAFSGLIKDVSGLILKSAGAAMVNVATNVGKTNIGADYSSSVALGVSMAELQEATFKNAQAMLANEGGAKRFNQQLKDLSSPELFKKVGYDPAKALDITSSTLSTVRAVIGKKTTSAEATREAKTMVDFYVKMADAGHTTVEEYANLTEQLANNAEIQGVLSKLNVTSRSEALRDIVMTRQHAMAMGLGKEKALEFAIALAATKNDKVASRFKAATAVVSMSMLATNLGYQGITQQQIMDFQRLEALGAGKTKEETTYFNTLVPLIGGARAFLERSQEGAGTAAFTTELALERYDEMLGGASNLAKSLQRATDMANAEGSKREAPPGPEAGRVDSTVGKAAEEAGALWNTIKMTLDGIFTKGMTVAIGSAIAAIGGSVLTMFGLMRVLKLNSSAVDRLTAAMSKYRPGGGGPGAGGPDIPGKDNPKPGGKGSKWRSGAKIAGGTAAGALLGLGISKLMEKEDATESEQTGGDVGSMIGGALGGALGTIYGGPVGMFIGQGIGSVAGQYLGTAIGGLMDKKEEKPTKVPANVPPTSTVPSTPNLPTPSKDQTSINPNENINQFKQVFGTQLTSVDGSLGQVSDNLSKLNRTVLDNSIVTKEGSDTFESFKSYTGTLVGTVLASGQQAFASGSTMLDRIINQIFGGGTTPTDQPAKGTSNTAAGRVNFPQYAGTFNAAQCFNTPSVMSPAMQVTQPIQRSTFEEKKTKEATDTNNKQVVDTTDVLKNLLKAQQTQNSLMSEYIDIYKQTNEPTTPFLFTSRPEQEPHKLR